MVSFRRISVVSILCVAACTFSTAQTRPAIINGLAGLVVREEDGAIDTLAFAHRDGRITAIYATRNPDKLHHVRF